MKKILFTVACLCSVLLYACKKDKEIGTPVDIRQDYILPQGNASQATNDKILSLYNTYGSFFLYQYTQKDFEWVQATGSGNSQTDSVVLGDPQYAGDMLQFLDDIWLKFLPDAFKKSQGIPYRVFMADTIKRRRPGTGYPPGMEFLYSDYKVSGKAIAFTGMNASLRTMSAADKLAKKNLYQGVIWNYYLGNGIVEFPAEFYNVSNYTAAAPATPLNTLNPANVEAYRTKGFLPSSYNAVSGAPFEWHNGTYSWTTAKTNDAASFLLNITQRSDAELAPYLTFPLIQQKYDILVDHFKNKYGIDVRVIANATY